MSRPRFALLAVAALLAICGAFYLSSQRNLPRDVRGAPLVPVLGAELDTVTELRLSKGAPAPAVTLHKTGAQWTVAQRGDYPADVGKLRRLLLALADARLVEEKTSDPANYPIIGVEDPAKAGAAGVEVGVVARDGTHSVILGKPTGEGTFVRRAGEARSYVAEPAVSAEPEPRAWIDTKLLDRSAASIQRLEVRPAGGAAYTLLRIKPKQDEFQLDHVPAGRKALDGKALAPSGTILSGLAAEDVAAASAVDFGQPSQAIFTMEDGDVLTLTGAVAGDKRWIEVHSTRDAALDAKTANRALELASYRYDAIFRPLDELLVPKETKPEAGTHVPGRDKARISSKSPASSPIS